MRLEYKVIVRLDNNKNHFAGSSDRTSPQYMLPNKINIFVLSNLEDDSAIINSTLRNSGVTVNALWSSDKTDCLKQLEQNNLHLIFFRSNNFSAQDEELIEKFRKIESTIPIIIIDDELSEQTLSASLQMNANDLVTLQISDRLLMVAMRELSNYLKTKELLKLRKEVTLYKNQLEQVQASSAVPFIIVQDGIILEANPAACKLLTDSADKELATQMILDFVLPDDQIILKGALKTVIKNQSLDNEIKIEMCKLDCEETIRVRCEIFQHIYDDEDAIKIELYQQMPTAIIQNATFTTDPLTGIFHRKQFIDACEKKLTQDLESGIITLIYIKVDRIKQMQNNLDIFSVDKVFSHIGEALVETCNKDDIYGRFAGNSFAVLTYKGSIADVESWAEHFQEYLKENLLSIGDEEVALSCSIGIAEISSDKDSLLDLITRAKEANFTARKSGHGNIHIDNSVSETTQTVQFDMAWLPRIKSALMQNRFQLFQFPISSLHGEGSNMLDVFLRMKDEVGDLVMPSVFLPVAERNNLAKSLDRWVLGAAIRYVQQNMDTKMFVRLTKSSVQDSNLLDWCNKVLKDYDVPASNLVLQFSENHVFDIGPQKISQTLANYRGLGYGIAIEHFGRNPSHLQLLEDLPIDYVKIDSTLIQGITENKDRQKTVKSLCKTARSKTIFTVAEHVESANSMAVLYQLGADYMQGTFTLEPEVIIAAE